MGAREWAGEGGTAARKENVRGDPDVKVKQWIFPKKGHRASGQESQRGWTGGGGIGPGGIKQ